MDEHVLEAKMRDQFGSRAARQLRRNGRLPANVYGHQRAGVQVTFDRREFEKFFNAGHRLALLDIEGKQEHGVIKEVQYDGMGSELLHVDISRVDRDEKIEMQVHLDLIGTPKGVSSGGVLDVVQHELAVLGPARRIPEVIHLDVQEVQVGEAVRIKDLTAPESCSFVGDPEEVVLVVHEPKAEAEPEVEETAVEPEVIKKTKEEGAE